MRKRIWALTSLIALSWAAATQAPAADIRKYDVGIAAGTSADGLDTTQFMLFFSRNFKLNEGLFLRLEPTVEFIDSSSPGDLFAAGLSATFRFAYPNDGLTPFMDVGTGINYVSRDEFGKHKLGGNVLFNLTAGAGLNLGSKYSLSYRFRHFSNADFYSENDGLDSHYLVLGMYF